MRRKSRSSPVMGRREVLAVLVPVVVGGLLGFFASFTTTVYTTRVAERQAVRKDRADHLERAMSLCARYSNDLGRLIGFGFMGGGDADARNLDVLSAPTNTLLELRAVVTLYAPTLRNDVEQLFQAHAAVMQRYDQIIDARHTQGDEDAQAFTQRIQAEISPLANRVRGLMEKIGNLGAQSD